MTGFYDITTHLKNILASNPSLPRVNIGQISDVLLSKMDMYPYAHIIVNNVVNDGNEGNILTWNISIICMDIVDISKEQTTELFLGNNDLQDVFNTQLSIIMRTVETLRRGQDTRTYQLDGAVNIEPFEDRFEHGVAGWTATFDVSMANDMTVCDEDIVPVCSPSIAQLINTLDEVISNTTIASGSASIIVAPDGTYTVQYENGTPIESGTVPSNGSIIISVPNPVGGNATVENSNATFTQTIPSGDTYVLEDYEFEFQDSLGNILDTEIRPAMVAETFLFENYCPVEFPFEIFVNGVSQGIQIVNINDNINININ